MCTNTNETCTRTILLCIKKFGRYKYINIKKRHLTQRNYKVEALGRKDARLGNIGPELCTECLKRFRKGFLKFWVSLCSKSCRWKRSWWSWIVSYGHTNCVITQQWTFYAFNNNKILLIPEGMRVDIETILSLEKNYTWIATWWSMWIGYIINKTQHDELFTKCPFSQPKINIKIQSSVSVLILCGLVWKFELEVRVFHCSLLTFTPPLCPNAN